MFVEIAFNETVYDNIINSIDVWIIAQIAINCIFAITLLLDWIFLGFWASYSRHSRVLVETIS
jgi:hypothetical protein